jgi:rhodanese-related sulfurtransferase
MEDNRRFKKRYFLMSSLLILLALVLFMLPEKYNSSELKPDRLLAELNDQTRFISPDELATKLINNYPYIQLIDVRSPEEFKKFSLPGAINIPLDKILDKDKSGNYVWDGILNQDVKKNIFYSDGSIYSNQAWMIVRRMNYKNNYILKGGLNAWVETIMRPKAPAQTTSQSEFDLYETRKAAAMHFGGGGNSGTSTVENTATSTDVKKTAKKKSGGGGC